MLPPHETSQQSTRPAEGYGHAVSSVPDNGVLRPSKPRTNETCRAVRAGPWRRVSFAGWRMVTDRASQAPGGHDDAPRHHDPGRWFGSATGTALLSRCVKPAAGDGSVTGKDDPDHLRDADRLLADRKRSLTREDLPATLDFIVGAGFRRMPHVPDQVLTEHGADGVIAVTGRDEMYLYWY